MKNKKSGRPKKRFCPKMHDKDIVGRVGNSGHGMCRKCFYDNEKEIRRKYRETHPDKRLVRFCKRGHDTHKTGRDIQGMCRDCRKPVNKEYRIKNKKILLAHYHTYKKKIAAEVRNYRVQKGCQDCKITDSRVLQFDHLGNKNFTIGSGLGVSRERLWKEIYKCEVVCANCHMIRTWNRKH